MDIQGLIDQGKTTALPIEQLRALAGNSGAFGQDLIDTFAGQAERRAVAAGTVLTTAEGENRELLASESRLYERHMREADAIRTLQSQVEVRTSHRGYVPPTQTSTDLAPPAKPFSPVLGLEQPIWHLRFCGA